MTRAHRVLAALTALVALAAILTAVTVAHSAPARPTPVAAAGTDDAHLIRAAVLRTNRDHRRAAIAHARAVAARAAAARRAARAAAAEKAARDRQTASYVVTGSAAGIPAVWMRVAHCEAPGQMWRTNTGNGYYGAFQIEWSNARFYGFRRPDLEPPLRQLALARLILRDQGVGAWPVCGPRAGLRRGD